MWVKHNWQRYSLGKASFIAGLIAFLLSTVYWIWYWVWTFFGFYKSFVGDLSLTGIVFFCISVFVTPIFVIVALLCGAFGSIQKYGKHKRLAHIGMIVSVLALMVYSLYFIY